MKGTRSIYIVTGTLLAMVAALSVFTYRSTERGVVDAYSAQQLAVSRTVAVGLETELSGLAVSLRQFSTLPTVQRLQLDFMNERIAAAFAHETSGAIHQIVRIDGEGRRYDYTTAGLRTDGPAPGVLDPAVWAWLADPANRDRVRVGPVMWASDGGPQFRVLAMPVWQVARSASQLEAPNSFNGLLAFVIDLERLVDSYASPVGAATVEGTLTLALDDGAAVHFQGGQVRTDQAKTPVAFGTEPHGTRVADVDGRRQVVAWSPVVVADRTWAVGITTPYERATATVRANAAGQLALIGLLLVAVPLVARLVATRERRGEEERRALQAQLLQAQKMEAIGKLAGGVAHDFNNLLTAILGYTSLILEEAPPGSSIHAEASQVRRAAESAATLTQKLLAFSRRQLLQPQRLDLSELMTDLHSLLRRLLGERVELRLDTAPEVWPVVADPVQIEQVVMNLAVNARDAMPDGGILSVGVRNVSLPEGEKRVDHVVLPGDYVQILASDTGTGMDEATRARMFEPFFTTKPKGKGTGLGMSTVYGIVKQSGGYIAVRSAPSVGTTIDILFPRATTDVPAAAPTPTVERELGGSETILLVEDDAAVRELTESALERSGYRVIAAASPEEALKLANDPGQHIDLLLSDVVMPGMLGPELARQVKAIRPDLRLLFMSGYAADVISSDMLQEAALLQKPFSSTVLTRAVRLVLDAQTQNV